MNNYSLREALEGVPSGDNPVGYLQHCVHNALLRERAGDLSRNQQRQLDGVLRFWTGGYQSLGLQHHLASGLYRALTQAIHDGAEDYCF